MQLCKHVYLNPFFFFFFFTRTMQRPIYQSWLGLDESPSFLLKKGRIFKSCHKLSPLQPQQSNFTNPIQAFPQNQSKHTKQWWGCKATSFKRVTQAFNQQLWMKLKRNKRSIEKLELGYLVSSFLLLLCVCYVCSSFILLFWWCT